MLLFQTLDFLIDINSFNYHSFLLLQVAPNCIHIRKGTRADIDSYSAFWDNEKKSQTELLSELTKAGVTDVYVCGLAYDVCVGKWLKSIRGGGLVPTISACTWWSCQATKTPANRDQLYPQSVVRLSGFSVSGQIESAELILIRTINPLRRRPNPAPAPPDGEVHPNLGHTAKYPCSICH